MFCLNPPRRDRRRRDQQNLCRFGLERLENRVLLSALDGMTISNRETVLSNAALHSAGLNYWPDGNMGVIKNGSQYTFFAANGSSIGKAVGTLNNPVANSASSSQILNMKNSYHYKAGGPVYKDPATGTMVMVYHAEKWVNGNNTQFWSLLGMARSTDGGNSWVDLGEIVSPQVGFGSTPHEITGGAIAVVGEYLHVYFRDLMQSGVGYTTSNLSVARAKIADVLSAAAGGNVTAFTKYHNGAWSQPGLGGFSSTLENGNPQSNFMAMSYNTHIGKYILTVVAGIDNWDLAMTESSDGINWSPRSVIESESGESYAPSAISTGADPNISGQQFYVYYVYSQIGEYNRWNDAILARRTITLAADTTAPTVTSGYYPYETSLNKVKFSFSENVSASLSASDLVVTTQPGGATVSVTGYIYDTSTNTATFTLAANLSNGDYRATLPAGSVSDSAGNALAAAFNCDFFILAGDANRDRQVDGADLSILAANWMQNGKTFSQGNVNYDPKVDSLDLLIVASNWQQTLDGTALAPLPIPSISSLISRPRSMSVTVAELGTVPARRSPLRVIQLI